MQYLIVDGMVSGTGVRERYGSAYLQTSELGISGALGSQISAWLVRYQDAHHAGFDDDEVVAALDAEGLTICQCLKTELPTAKIEYFSAAQARRLAI